MKQLINPYYYLALSFVVFVYVLIRVFTVEITYDEAWTMRDFVPQSFIHILNFTPSSTNNHILNTLLVKSLLKVFDESLFIIRLPNLVALVVYLFFSYKITSSFLPFPVAPIAFALLLLNPFLLDFFGLARGYGLAFGFETASVYFVLKFFRDDQRTKDLAAACAFAALSVLANFSLLHLYFGVAGLLFIRTCLSKSNRATNLLTGIIITGILSVIIWEPLRKILVNNELDYGGEVGFYQDTLISLVKYSGYSQITTPAVLVTLNCLLVIFSVVVTGSLFQKHFFSGERPAVLYLMGICILSMVTQHHLLGTFYVVDRSALILYPLIVLVFSFSLASIRTKWLKPVLMVPLALIVVVNFVLHANFRYTAIWFFNAHNREILEKINEQGRLLNKKQKVDFSWPLNSAFLYYDTRNHYEFIDMNHDSHVKHEYAFDYYIWLAQPLDRIVYYPDREIIHPMAKDTLVVYKDVGLYVFNGFKWE